MELEGVRLVGIHRCQMVSGLDVGYDAWRRCQIAWVVVATRCAALEGDGGRQEGMTTVSSNERGE